MKFNSSITENILVEAVLCRSYIQISEKDFRIMKDCRKLLQYNEDEPWKKKNQEICFDVAM